MPTFDQWYGAGRQNKKDREDREFGTLAGQLQTSTNRAPVIQQMSAINPQGALQFGKYYQDQDAQAAEAAKLKDREGAMLSLNKVRVIRTAPKGKKLPMIQQVAPEWYAQNMADGTPPTDEEIDSYIDSNIAELYTRAGQEMPEPAGPRYLQSGGDVLEAGPDGVKRVYQGDSQQQPGYNMQLVTRPVGNGKVQDFNYDPRSGQLKPTGQPYDADPGGVNSRKGAMPLRKEFRSLPSVKEYETVVPLIESAKTAPNTGYGDLQLIYTVGKTLDPGSVVREGELALTIASGSPLQRLLGATQFNFEQGGRLTPKQRAAIIEMLQQRVGAAKKSYDRDFEQYSQYAKDSGVDPSMVVGSTIDSAFAPPAAQQGGPVRVSSPQEAMALPPGTQFQTPDGRIKVRP